MVLPLIKKDYVGKFEEIINLKGHQNCTTGSRAKAILLKGKLLPIGGVASGRVCACSLHSRLVFKACVKCQVSHEWSHVRCQISHVTRHMLCIKSISKF